MTNLSTEWLPGITGPWWLAEKRSSINPNETALGISGDDASTTTHLWGVSVVEHAEDHPGHGVLRVRHVSRGGEGGQVVLQGLAQHAVKSDVRAEDVALLPAVFLQLLNLGPQTVQVLNEGQDRRKKTQKVTQGKVNIIQGDSFQ